MHIDLFVPCFVDLVAPRAAIGALAVLERLGHAVRFHEELVCCGQPPFNAGRWDEARSLARRALVALRDAEAVVVVSGSCAAMIKVSYPELFRGTTEEQDARDLAARSWEFSDFLVGGLGVLDVGASFPHRVTFHDGCHGLRELGTRSAPRALLAHVRGLSLVEPSHAGVCCGFGGVFSVKQPAISAAMGESKLADIGGTGAEYVASNDSSCLIHLQGLLDRRGSAVRTIHLAEILAFS